MDLYRLPEVTDPIVFCGVDILLGPADSGGSLFITVVLSDLPGVPALHVINAFERIADALYPKCLAPIPKDRIIWIYHQPRNLTIGYGAKFDFIQFQEAQRADQVDFSRCKLKPVSGGELYDWLRRAVDAAVISAITLRMMREETIIRDKNSDDAPM